MINYECEHVSEIVGIWITKTEIYTNDRTFSYVTVIFKKCLKRRIGLYIAGKEKLCSKKAQTLWIRVTGWFFEFFL